MGGGLAAGEPQFDRVRMVLGERDSGVLATIEKAMAARGLRRLRTCGTADALYEALDVEIADVLVFDYDLLGPDFSTVMQRIRRNGRGKNPFIVMIATISDSQPETVQRLIGSGVDDLIRKPFSIDRLFESVASFSQDRKPFFISYNYVGPTRRSGHRAVEPANQILRVPNTLRGRSIERVSDDELAQIVGKAVRSLDEKQFESCGIEIDQLATSISQNMGTGATHEDRQDVRGALFRIEAVADDLRRRSAGTQFERIGDLATMLIALTQRVLRAQDVVSMVELQLLVKLSAAIRRALSVERHSVDVMREITQTIANFTKTN
jgi:DNA-binding response OmpR family regulator